MSNSIDFDALKPGDEFDLGPFLVTREEIIRFAREFDPAPFHLDDKQAERSLLGGLATSGWQTCAIAMRMMCDAYVLKSNSLGSPGIHYCRWLKPVMAGDTLSGKSTILSKRVSRTKPGIGIAEISHTIANQNGETVLEMANTGFFQQT